MSNYIIVHSQDAINYFTKAKSKVFFLNHPVYPKIKNPSAVCLCKNIDVLIWGSIIPYKGLTQFIENYRKYNVHFSATIIGKADKNYLNQLKKSASGLNITIENKFLTEEELDCYFKNTKIILLPYLDKDTFSSGSLIHSLNSNKIVIGPSMGNFIDLHKGNACLIYNDSSDLFKTINELLEDKIYYAKTLDTLTNGIEKYYKSNSWDQFIQNLLDIVSGKRLK